MTSLDEAWDWYQAAEGLADTARRLGEKYWDDLPADGPIGRDHRLREVTGGDLVADARKVRDPLADLAVVVLFSVFEDGVRTYVQTQVEREKATLVHPTLRKAAEDALEAINEGSFARVLDPFKALGHADLIEGVNQVRRYRNWVAHGRRGREPDRVSPRKAYDRLSEFLALVPTFTPTPHDPG